MSTISKRIRTLFYELIFTDNSIQEIQHSVAICLKRMSLTLCLIYNKTMPGLSIYIFLLENFTEKRKQPLKFHQLDGEKTFLIKKGVQFG